MGPGHSLVRMKPPTPRLVAILAATTLALVSSACTYSPVCSSNIVPGLVVTVVDSVTGAFVADSASGTVITTAKDWGDTLSVGYPGHTLEGAWERAGTFDITVSRPGYNDWIASSVVVTKVGCHVRSVQLLARMQK